MNDKDRAKFDEMFPGQHPGVVSGKVIEDEDRRWATGSAMRSTVLVGFDLQNMRCVTQNSVYLLQGPGLIKPGFPVDYALAVGETILTLGHIPRNPGPDGPAQGLLSDVANNF